MFSSFFNFNFHSGCFYFILVTITTIITLILIVPINPSIIDALKAEIDEDFMKSLTCMAVVNKLIKVQQSDKNEISQKVLYCLATITDSQLDKYLDQLKNGNVLTYGEHLKELEELTDSFSLTRKFNTEEVIGYSKSLNKALEKFNELQKAHEEMSVFDMIKMREMLIKKKEELKRKKLRGGSGSGVLIDNGDEDDESNIEIEIEGCFEALWYICKYFYSKERSFGDHVSVLLLLYIFLRGVNNCLFKKNTDEKINNKNNNGNNNNMNNNSGSLPSGSSIGNKRKKKEIKLLRIK